MSGARIRVGVLGAGTVGREVVRGLLERGPARAPAESPSLEVAGVAVRDVERAIAAGIPRSLVSDAPAHLVAADDIDVIVELMGGDEPARTLIAAALSMGKAVVTANKHVMAHHGAELEANARRTDAQLRFEAAVGAGIPILGPLATDLATNDIRRVRGIVNGTTNFILTAMTDESAPMEYAEALAEAQRLGYAEADPSADVEGLDAVNKLVILARLAFGRWLDPAAIPNRPDGADGPAGPGITTVSLADQAEARAAGRIIRLLAAATLEADGSVRAAVLPTAVPFDSPLGRTAGVRNRIEVDAEPVGRVGFDGPGAGGPATSSAVLGDILAVARAAGSTWGQRPPAVSVDDAVWPPIADVLTVSSGIHYPVAD
jgi:homoserine dehydrogenase